MSASKRLLIVLLIGFSVSTQAANLFPDTACYFECPNTPSGKLPMEFFNIPAFQQSDSCHALQGFCQWVNMTSPLAIKPVIITDYDGTLASEKVSIHARESYISDRARSENSIAFGVIAPKLKSLGYDIGMQTGDLSNLAAAQYIAARDDSCETADFNSKQVKFDYCLGGRMVGMTAQQVKALHGVMYRVFPKLNTYFSTTQAMLNYLVEMGYPLWTQSGGTPYPTIVKASMHPQTFNTVFSRKTCNFVARNSTVMNKLCPIISDAPKISLGKVTLVMNTENVCDGVSYAKAEKTGKPQLCIDDGEGKVSGVHRIEKITKNAVLNFNGNSDGDVYPGLYVAKNGGIVFIHNNASVCEAINKAVPGSCFNIVDPESDTAKKLTSPNDDLYSIAAEQEGLLESYREARIATIKK